MIPIISFKSMAMIISFLVFTNCRPNLFVFISDSVADVSRRDKQLRNNNPPIEALIFLRKYLNP